VAAGDVERHDDPVAHPERASLGADLLDDPHELVPEHVTALEEGRQHAVEVQVRTADGRGRHPQDDVVGVLDGRIGDGIDADIVGTVVGQGSHGGLRRAVST